MEEKYNPMKSAEIATEHNYNMLDGILNNQAPPPEQEKPLEKSLERLADAVRIFLEIKNAEPRTA